nr:hypothetical protein [Phascolarctobacterium sp.]
MSSFNIAHMRFGNTDLLCQIFLQNTLLDPRQFDSFADGTVINHHE